VGIWGNGVWEVGSIGVCECGIMGVGALGYCGMWVGGVGNIRVWEYVSMGVCDAGMRLTKYRCHDWNAGWMGHDSGYSGIPHFSSTPALHLTALIVCVFRCISHVSLALRMEVDKLIYLPLPEFAKVLQQKSKRNDSSFTDASKWAKLKIEIKDLTGHLDMRSNQKDGSVAALSCNKYCEAIV
jgi:hypothetical protein